MQITSFISSLENCRSCCYINFVHLWKLLSSNNPLHLNEVNILETHNAQTFEWPRDCTKLQATIAHLKAFSEFYNSHCFNRWNQNISLFGLILIHCSCWPATVGPVIKVSFFFLSRNAIALQQHLISIHWSPCECLPDIFFYKTEILRELIVL